MFDDTSGHYEVCQKLNANNDNVDSQTRLLCDWTDKPIQNSIDWVCCWSGCLNSVMVFILSGGNPPMNDLFVSAC